MQCTERQYVLHAEKGSLAPTAGRDRGAVGPGMHRTGPPPLTHQILKPLEDTHFCARLLHEGHEILFGNTNRFATAAKFGPLDPTATFFHSHVIICLCKRYFRVQTAFFW